MSLTTTGGVQKKYVRFVAVSVTPTALTTREIEEASADDEELRGVEKTIATGRFEKCRQYITVRESWVSLVSSCFEVTHFYS